MRQIRFALPPLTNLNTFLAVHAHVLWQRNQPQYCDYG